MKGLTGKRYFYRLGLRDGLTGMPIMSSRVGPIPSGWPRDAYWRGHGDGAYQYRIANCQHEPLENRQNRREVPRCFHCGMKMRALRRRSA